MDYDIQPHIDTPTERADFAYRKQLVTALRDIIRANDEFRKTLPDNWESNPVNDACERARSLING